MITACERCGKPARIGKPCSCGWNGRMTVNSYVELEYRQKMR